MKKKKKLRKFEIESDKSVFTFIIFDNSREISKLIRDNMFRFLSDIFRSMIFFEINIILSFLSSESSKLFSQSKFPKIVIEMFHDEVSLQKIKNEINKNKTEKLMYMKFKINNEIHQSVLYDEYEKIVFSFHVIFEKSYALFSKKTKIHVKMFNIFDATKKTHYENKLKMIQN